jgi:hypothetical protein
MKTDSIQLQEFVQKISTNPNVAILVESGAVGEEAVEHLTSREFAVLEPTRLDSSRSLPIVYHWEQSYACRGLGGPDAVAPVTLGLTGVVTLLKTPAGIAFSAAPVTSTAFVAGAGLAGYGLGTLLDHAVGWVRDDGRSVSDLLSGANAGIPVTDPNGHGGTGWRFVADEK